MSCLTNTNKSLSSNSVAGILMWSLWSQSCGQRPISKQSCLKMLSYNILSRSSDENNVKKTTKTQNNSFERYKKHERSNNNKLATTIEEDSGERQTKFVDIVFFSWRMSVTRGFLNTQQNRILIFHYLNQI